MELAIWLLAALLVAALVRYARRRVGTRAGREFEALVFRTPEGPVPGRRMESLKTVVDVTGLESPWPRGSVFRYCKGPGPSYFVAIREPGEPGRWVVRPLEPEQLRGALVDDPDALRLAFPEPEPPRD
ncbi:hypothetical protein LDO32_01935 [Luteimonas sp. Y-2-2-4F]|nr:hypothetical protein [Luteimonas sp. Y-2-2-4F]MCD9030494.1 hypothetical protein [Luteimonas sp. Y-2-2-4F]